MSTAEPLGIDRALGFTLPHRHARGRVVRLGPVLGEVLAAHQYPPPLRHLLAEALTLAALMGALLKADGGQLTLQTQGGEGAVDLLVADYRAGALRGYVRHDAATLASAEPAPGMAELLCGGHLAITFDLAGAGERYQGIVPVIGVSLAEACEAYFAQSEQVPTLIRIAIDDYGGGLVAGGLLVQHLAEGEEGRERLHVRMDHPEWDHVAALGGSISAEELTDPALALDDILWRLFHEEHEIRVGQPVELSRGCRCSEAHFRDVLARFPPEEVEEMRGPDGVISVDCAFCARLFVIDL